MVRRRRPLNIDASERLLTVNEVAAILNKHFQTVIALIKRGELPAMRIGREYRVSRQDLSDFLREHRLSEQT
ncbi:helix-turn-helix domain-containing protein [bacterium]|nr:helix-turn-helix domain-containing protein [bacterium]